MFLTRLAFAVALWVGLFLFAGCEAPSITQERKIRDIKRTCLDYAADHTDSYEDQNEYVVICRWEKPNVQPTLKPKGPIQSLPHP
jgi:hypothetical protein